MNVKFLKYCVFFSKIRTFPKIECSEFSRNNFNIAGLTTLFVNDINKG